MKRKPQGTGQAVGAVLVGEEDPIFAGGSYVIVQKYLHNMDGWNALSSEDQERIIGRKKLSDIELDDSGEANLSAQRPSETIVENGKGDQDPARQHALWRVSHGEFGTYFIGYSRSPLLSYKNARKHVHRPAAR